MCDILSLDTYKMDLRKNVLLITSGMRQEGQTKIVPIVQATTSSLRRLDWDITLGIVDNRTNLHCIIRSIIKLRRERILSGAALVHAHYGSILSLIARLICGPIPLIIEFLGDDLIGTPIKGLVWRIRERVSRFAGLWAANKAEKIIVVSQNLYEALPSRLHQRSVIMPEGVDVEKFRPYDKLKARNELSWDAEQPIVLFNASHGSNQTTKNLPLAFDTIEIVKRDFPNVQLQILSQLSQNKVVQMMNASDCLLITSLHEGSPNIVKEAMACNLPVISVPCGDVKERIEMVTPGEICNYDALELAGAIRKVLKSDIRSNGREQIHKQGLTIEETAKQLINIYTEIQTKLLTRKF